jgi:hypothetical protein
VVDHWVRNRRDGLLLMAEVWNLTLLQLVWLVLRLLVAVVKWKMRKWQFSKRDASLMYLRGEESLVYLLRPLPVDFALERLMILRAIEPKNQSKGAQNQDNCQDVYKDYV